MLSLRACVRTPSPVALRMFSVLLVWPNTARERCDRLPSAGYPLRRSHRECSLAGVPIPSLKNRTRTPMDALSGIPPNLADMMSTDG